MDDAIYLAASGMHAVERMLDSATFNTVNADTPGFQRNRVTMQSFGSLLEDAGDRAGLVGTRESVEFTQGTLRPTDLPYAVALEGPGFLAVTGFEGETLYTRNGDFSVDAEGTLRTRSGLAVAGEGGAPITVDPRLGTVAIEADGALVQQGQEIGRLRVVEFDAAARSSLQSVSETLYRAPESLTPEAAVRTSVRHRYLEMPKYGGVKGLVDMLIAKKNHESMAKAIEALNGAHERLIQTVE